MTTDTEPRIVQIFDGVFAQATLKVSPLPPHLDVTEHQGRILPCGPAGKGQCVPLLRSLQVTRQSQPRVRGVRRDCLEAEHQREHWLSGRFAGLDLVLTVCVFCWCVEVRDVSFSILIDQAPDGRTLRLTPRGKARRKDDVLGLYSGRRPSGRVHL